VDSAFVLPYFPTGVNTPNSIFCRMPDGHGQIVHHG